MGHSEKLTSKFDHRRIFIPWWYPYVPPPTVKTDGVAISSFSIFGNHGTPKT
jgi:hypothetical protein